MGGSPSVTRFSFGAITPVWARAGVSRSSTAAVRRLWILVMGVGPGAAKLRPREPISERRGVACGARRCRGAQQCCAPTPEDARAVAFRGARTGRAGDGLQVSRQPRLLQEARARFPADRARRRLLPLRRERQAVS